MEIIKSDSGVYFYRFSFSVFREPHVIRLRVFVTVRIFSCVSQQGTNRIYRFMKFVFSKNEPITPVQLLCKWVLDLRKKQFIHSHFIITKSTTKVFVFYFILPVLVPDTGNKNTVESIENILNNQLQRFIRRATI
jgi:hypothetical protein